MSSKGSAPGGRQPANNSDGLAYRNALQRNGMHRIATVSGNHAAPTSPQVKPPFAAAHHQHPGVAASRCVRVWGSAQSGVQKCALTSTNGVSFFKLGPHRHSGPWTDLFTKFFQPPNTVETLRFLANIAANGFVGQRFTANSARSKGLI